MKAPVHEAVGMSGVEVRGQRAEAREQVLEGGGAELAQRSIQYDAIGLGRNRKRPGVIES